jgi:hypothetical protein
MPQLPLVSQQPPQIAAQPLDASSPVALSPASSPGVASSPRVLPLPESSPWDVPLALPLLALPLELLPDDADASAPPPEVGVLVGWVIV